MPVISLSLAVFAVLTVFTAAVLRGMCGFGFSMAVVVLLSMVAPPAHIVPVVLLWEIIASIGHLPFVWKDVDWKSLRGLAVGIIIGTPVGVWLLASVPATPMIIVINSTIILCCGFMLYGYKATTTPTRTHVLGTGLLGGLLNGACANGGLPLIIFFLSSPAAAATGRASLIAFFLFTDVWASVFAIQQGLMTLNSLWVALACTPVLFAGIWTGGKLFARIDEARFKRVSLWLLTGLACAGLLREIL